MGWRLSGQTLFEWDPAKAAANLAKHGVSFEQAMGVFADALALSVLDRAAPADEERWVTIGASGAAGLLLVVHTHVELDENDDDDPHHLGAATDTKRAKAL